jgi:hypothetical protein
MGVRKVGEIKKHNNVRVNVDRVNTAR